MKAIKVCLLYVTTLLCLIAALLAVTPTIAKSETDRDMADRSVKQFNTLIDKRCGKLLGNTPDRIDCMKLAARYWLENDGKRYENINSSLITGNDLARTFLQLQPKSKVKTFFNSTFIVIAYIVSGIISIITIYCVLYFYGGLLKDFCLAIYLSINSVVLRWHRKK